MEVIFALILGLNCGGVWDEIFPPEEEGAPQVIEQDAFWPPDMIPHPTVPGDGPTGAGEPELA